MIETRHDVIVCTRCRTDDGARPGPELMAMLAPRLDADIWRVAGVECLAGCERPLAVGFRAPEKAAFLFGDIVPAADCEGLAEFAAFYASLPDGWCNEGQRPLALRNKTLARIPALPREGAR
ncbi:MAG: hypothetical protein DI629_00820 [Mesorhizobium amorphae]|nr:MAG: hypothetical protein DI629_00820 [Mesorhizobium amorphae]